MQPVRFGDVNNGSAKNVTTCGAVKSELTIAEDAAAQKGSRKDAREGCESHPRGCWRRAFFRTLRVALSSLRRGAHPAECPRIVR